MRMFLDVFSGCNIASDAFPHKVCHEGAAIKFEAKFVTKTEDLGGIPAGEGDDEGPSDGETVIDLVDAYNLHPVPDLTSAEWMAIVKGIMKKVIGIVKEQEDMDDDKLKAYKKGCVGFVNFIKSNFKDIQLYQGDIGDYAEEEQSYGYALNENQDDPLSLNFYFFKDALKDVKY